MAVVQISVVIPVKDDAVALTRCLTALAEQTHPPFEVIVVDDSSVDDSAAIARRFGARVVTHTGAGIPASSACGYDAALGDVIARLDADSVPPCEWIERVVRRFERGDADAVTGPGRFVGFGPVRQMLARLVYMDAYFFWMGLALAHPPLYGSALAMRRDVWRAVEPRVHRDDPRLHDDVDLSLHVGLRYRIVVDRSLAVGVERAIFADTRGMLRRYDRAFYTLRHHGLSGVAVLRWRRRLLLALGR